MDNNEYKLRMEQLVKVLDEEKYSVASKLADSLDWRRVTNIKNLNIIAKAYRMVKDYEQELEVLQLAYGQSTTGRAILENLIKCAINLEDLNLSIKYYNEYIRLFPNANTYYLKFLLYRLQGASRQELISILKEHYNGADEKAMFDLAVLYYREGMINQCIDTCDDIIMFCHPCNESYKAMELKMKFMPLNEVQMEKYREKHKNIEVPKPDSKEVRLKQEDLPDDIVIPEYSPSQENAEKLQEDLSMSVKSLMNEEEEIANPQFFTKPQKGFDTDEEVDLQIPGQMSLEEMLTDLRIKKEEALTDYRNKKEEAVNMIASYRNSTGPLHMEQSDTNPYLSPEALMTARTKELSVDRIVTSPQVQKPGSIPPVALGETQSLDLMKDIMQDLSMIKGNGFDEEKEDGFSYAEEEFFKNDKSEVEGASYETESFNEDADDREPDPELQEDLRMEDHREPEYPQETRNASDSDFDHLDEAEIDDRNNESDISDKDRYEEEAEDNVPDYYNPVESVPEEDGGYPDLTDTKEDFTLTQMHKQTLGYFANIPDFNRSLSKAIRYLSSGKRYMAISSISQDNRVNLSKRLIEAAHKDMGNTNVKLAISNGAILNEKNISDVFEKISGGFLIIDEVSDLTIPTVERIYGSLLIHPDIGLVICDVESDLKTFFELNSQLAELINVRVRLPILTNDELTNFGEEYAQKKGYVLDEMAKLAIYDTIGRLRQSENMVTVAEIKELIDKAINKKESKGFGLFGRNRAAGNVLQEKDLLIKG